MCELLGISGSTPIQVNEYLRAITSHSIDHPNGWGMALFYDNAVSLEKEPIPAYQSRYLKERLQHPFEAQNMFAHIRLATKGNMVYENCHPFVKRDSTGRAWTLIHNGTIFDCPAIDPYFHMQEGGTDSERILYYIIDCIDRQTKKLKRELCSWERFEVLDRILCQITLPNNKVNLMVYDSDLMYIHTNMKDTLYYKELPGSMVFSTVPLDDGSWKPVPFTTLLAYREGKLSFSGTNHGNEYIYRPEDMKLLYLDQAYL